MGKIHNRLKTRKQRLHTIVVDARVMSALKPDMAVGQLTDTARRMSVFMQDLDAARRLRLTDGDRHVMMQGLATAAKELGLKGSWNLLCNVTQCLRESATWYNRGSYAFYCESCARMLNRVNARDAEDLLGAGQALCINIGTIEEAAKLHVTP